MPSYSEINVENEEEKEDDFAKLEARNKVSGKLKIKLINVVKLMNRTAEEIQVNIFVDGFKKYSTRPSKANWDETAELVLDKAHEVEISISSKTGAVLALSWFKLQDLATYLNQKKSPDHDSKYFSDKRSGNGF